MILNVWDEDDMEILKTYVGKHISMLSSVVINGAYPLIYFDGQIVDFVDGDMCLIFGGRSLAYKNAPCVKFDEKREAYVIV